MITIEITNNKGKLIGDIKKLMQVQKAFKIKNPNAYFIRMRAKNVQPNWDGMIWYVTEANYFKIGLLPQVYDFIVNTMKEEVQFIDHRLDFDIKPLIPKQIGDNTPRDYQGEAISSVVNNKVGDLHFPICVIDAATNAGKTTIMAGIYLAYKRKIPALVLLNDGDLFEQFKEEIPKLVGNDFGYVRGKDAKWGKFTIAMVQTLSQKIDIYRDKLSQYGILLVDEADLADNKTYKTILQYCSNANVRVGLSGSIFLSKLKKDFQKNQNLHSFFGNTVFKITKKEMVEKGHSTNIVIRMFPGSKKPGIKGDFKAEYDRGITYNEDRAMESINRMKYHIKRKHLPAIVVCQFHNHVELMYKVYQRELGKRYRIAFVHHAVKDRKKIFEKFRKGEIDILISSFIIKRGKNFPLVKYLQNAAGSDSHETILQIMGRLERKHKSKNKSYMEDFYDEGVYLSRHSKHRYSYYLQTQFKVIKKF